MDYADRKTEDLRAMRTAARQTYNDITREMHARGEIENKRDALMSRRFKKMQHNNSSGHKGVTFNKSADKWQAKIGGVHLGYFASSEGAADARKAAEASTWGEPG